MKDNNKKGNIDNKLFMNNYKVDSMSHLTIKDQAVCEKCEDKSCTILCPAHVYEWKDEQIMVSYEGCLECGACRIACPHDNIDWNFPRGGYGIQFRLA
ncbi:ferredoxin family protein [Clostridium aminobutyricum]|uniref:Ferredoxin-like protein n=1 Tax=Clostridium aminobutyricum TaxID=33953 RepID=A0A939IIF3_CLOAM|nr:4Fe-4S dicluster domain-containing protein [Clostridium aminobutyricum]MBN7772498.1 4Fe-4S dicluster domain-containing protein [Clostridium aminobutyricum]